MDARSSTEGRPGSWVPLVPMSGGMVEPHGTLLIVDDEENILRSLSRLLRQDGYRILTATDGETGLKLLEKTPVEVIVSDMRMPGMNGVEFLGRVRDLYPDTIRIVLSGYTDLNSITEAINAGAIYKFLTKPWDDGLLRTNIRAAFRQYALEYGHHCLCNELKRLRLVLEELPVGVLILDPRGGVAKYNKRAVELLGQRPDTDTPAAALPPALTALAARVATERQALQEPVEIAGAGRVLAHALPGGFECDGAGSGVTIVLIA